MAKDILLVSLSEWRGSRFLENLGRKRQRHSSGGGDHSPLLGLSSLASPPPPLVVPPLTQSQVGDHAGEDEGCQEGEGEDERIKEAVVPSPDTVAHPGAVMVKPF